MRNNKNYRELAKNIARNFDIGNTRNYKTLITDHRMFRDLEHARSIVRYYRAHWAIQKRSSKDYSVDYLADSDDFTPYRITEFPVAVCGDMHMRTMTSNVAIRDHCYRYNPRRSY